VSNSAGGVVGQKLADSLAVGLNVVRLPDGRTVALTTTSDARQLTVDAPFATPGVIVTPNAQGGYTVQLDSYGGLAINADGNRKGIDIQLPEQLDDFNLD